MGPEEAQIRPAGDGVVVPERILRELGPLRALVVGLVEQLPTARHEQLLCRSWALLDLAHEFVDVRTRSFGERLIDIRDAFMADLQCAIAERTQ